MSRSPGYSEYDAFSKTFARSRDRMRWSETETLVRTLLERIPQGKIPGILDVGCGS